MRRVTDKMRIWQINQTVKNDLFKVSARDGKRTENHCSSRSTDTLLKYFYYFNYKKLLVLKNTTVTVQSTFPKPTQTIDV